MKASTTFYIDMNVVKDAKEKFGNISPIVNEFLEKITYGLEEIKDYDLEEKRMQLQELRQRRMDVTSQERKVENEIFLMEKAQQEREEKRRVEEQEALEIAKIQDIKEDALNRESNIQEAQFLFTFRNDWNNEEVLEQKVKQYNVMFDTDYSIDHLKIRIRKFSEKKKVRS